jgi:hypothetical protein
MTSRSDRRRPSYYTASTVQPAPELFERSSLPAHGGSQHEFSGKAGDVATLQHPDKTQRLKRGWAIAREVGRKGIGFIRANGGEMGYVCQAAACR